MKSLSSKLLHAIWSNEAEPMDVQTNEILSQALADLLKTPITLIAVPAGELCGRVFRAESELAPELPVADVLELEFDIEVPDGAAIVCVSENVFKNGAGVVCPEWLGSVCAQIVVDAVHTSNVALTTERSAMRRLSGALVTRFAQQTPMKSTQGFRVGLMTGFHNALSGPMQTTDTLIELPIEEVGPSIFAGEHLPLDLGDAEIGGANCTDLSTDIDAFGVFQAAFKTPGVTQSAAFFRN